MWKLDQKLNDNLRSTGCIIEIVVSSACPDLYAVKKHFLAKSIGL